MSHVEAKSVEIWLKYQPFTMCHVFVNISAISQCILLQYGLFWIPAKWTTNGVNLLIRIFIRPRSHPNIRIIRWKFYISHSLDLPFVGAIQKSTSSSRPADRALRTGAAAAAASFRQCAAPLPNSSWRWASTVEVSTSAPSSTSIKICNYFIT